MRERVNGFAKKLYIAAVVLSLILLVTTYIFTDIYAHLGLNPGIIPVVGVVALLVSGYFINRKQEGWAFILVAVNIVFTLITFFMIMFPRVMISSTDPSYSLTIYNASSSAYTLSVMSIIALIFVPIVLVYQGWTYYMFRKRITTKKETFVY